MTISVTMPQLGESVSEGTVTRWLKSVGDTVTADEPLVEISTDKVDTEIPAPASGVLLSITAAEDEVVLVGGELAVIGDSADTSAAPAPAAPAPVAPAPAADGSPFSPGPSLAQSDAPPAAMAAAPPAAQPTSPALLRTGAVNGAGTPVVLPALGESVAEGTVTRWLKAVGDTVAVDEPLVEISTDKVDTEIPSPVAGTVLAILVNIDETAEVGATLALIGSTDGSAQPPAATPPAAPAAVPASSTPTPPEPVSAAAPAPSAPTPPEPASPSQGADEDAAAYVTPLVRKLASDLGVDLAKVSGTGVGGRIRKQDVQAAVSGTAPVAVPVATGPTTADTGGLRGSTVALTRLRKVIATRMVESLQTSAQLTTVVEVDISRVASLRARVKDNFAATEGVKLSFLPFFAKATVEALKIYPQLNASIDLAAGEVTYHDGAHLGVAVDTERGLLVPVIHGAGDLNIAGLARKIADLAARTRSNKVSPDELSGGTFTLTNTGSRGALFDTPILNQPQVGILGTGTVVRRPVVVADDTGAESIAIRSMVYLALTYDHRLVDGADAARFLTTIKGRLEDGAFDAEFGSE